MTDKILKEESFPALYQAADAASINAQKNYYTYLRSYLFLLIAAAFVSYNWPQNAYGAISSAAIFLITLGILIWLKLNKPEDTWYNGRAVAESVKTRTWRWVMKAEPYDKNGAGERTQKEFLSDLKAILNQNRTLSSSLAMTPSLGETITEEMEEVRNKTWKERLEIYKTERIVDQAKWYARKSIFNKKRAQQWFVASIALHSCAILMLLYRIKHPEVSLPIEVIATAASAVLTWLQAKKHAELNASYSLTAHEIALIKSESASIQNEKQLSDFVVNSEAAFSREHTQWIARKNV